MPSGQSNMAANCQRLVVMLNDTDTVMRLLYFTHTLVRDNLKNLYVEFGTSEKRAPFPTSRVGKHRGLVLEMVHAFIGNEVGSRIGTKHAVMQCNPIVYLTEFDDRTELPETVIAQVEEYLLQGWAGARSKP